MSERRIRGMCEKISVPDAEGTAILGCRGKDGQPILHCGEAPDYRDSALPLPEQLCIRALAAHEPHMNDIFKQPYVSVCHNLDELLADPYRAGSYENLDQRFDVMERELDAMIASPELGEADNGRYLYHIDARTLRVYMPAFRYRAKVDHNGAKDIPREIIEDTYKDVVGILSDFSSLYEGVATQVALRRTEVEILALLLRTKDPKFFPWPTLFREDASETRHYNHDAYILNNNHKTTIQITNTDYKLPNGKHKSESYAPETIVAIHQQVVNLDYRDGDTTVTRVSEEPRPIAHEHDIVDDTYEEFDEQPRFVAWGAVDVAEPTEQFAGEYVQEFGGTRRDGLVKALVKESKGHRILPNEMNLLNGASHYLMAIVREKQSDKL